MRGKAATEGASCFITPKISRCTLKQGEKYHVDVVDVVLVIAPRHLGGKVG